MKVIRRPAILATLLALVFLVTLTETARAKGGVGQITVAGPGLAHPIVIDDAPILDEFNPWGGLWLFLAERIEGAMPSTRGLEGPFRVAFVGAVHDWVYEFSYYLDRDADVGYIILPPPPTSQGFVHPSGWYRSSEAWNRVMIEQLERSQTPAGPGSAVDGGLLLPLVAIALIVAIGLAAHPRRRHPTGTAARQAG